MQNTTNQSVVADDASQSIDEGVYIQENGDQVAVPAPASLKKNKKKAHKPMNAAEQVASMAMLQEKLKLFEKVGATAARPVDTTAEVPVAVESPTTPEPVVKKRKVSDVRALSSDMPTPEAIPAAVPPAINTASPKSVATSRRRGSSIASRSSEQEDPYCPNKVKQLMDKLNGLGIGMEKAISEVISRAKKLVVGEGAEAIRDRLTELEKEWKMGNRYVSASLPIQHQLLRHCNASLWV